MGSLGRYRPPGSRARTPAGGTARIVVGPRPGRRRARASHPDGRWRTAARLSPEVQGRQARSAMPGFVFGTLRRHRVAQGERALSFGLPRPELVVCNAIGEPFQPATFSRIWKDWASDHGFG